MTPNERFCRAAGICPHSDGVEFDGARYRCPKCDATIDCDDPSPDFSDAREVLKVMREREDWKDFIASVGYWQKYTENVEDEMLAIDIDFILYRTGKLRDLATEWMEAQHNSREADLTKAIDKIGGPT